MEASLRMEIKDVCELMDEAGNFKLSRPNYIFEYQTLFIYMHPDQNYYNDDLYDDNNVQTFQTKLHF